MKTEVTNQVVVIKEIVVHLDINDLGTALASFLKTKEAELPTDFGSLAGVKFGVKYEIDATDPSQPKLIGARITLNK